MLSGRMFSRIIMASKSTWAWKYIDNLFIKVNHAHPMKPCLSPYKYAPITYETKTQLALDMDTSESKQCPQKLLPRNCWIPSLLSCLCSGQQATCCTQCLMQAILIVPYLHTFGTPGIMPDTTRVSKARLPSQNLLLIWKVTTSAS